MVKKVVRKLNKGLIILVAIISLLIGLCAGIFIHYYLNPIENETLISGDLQIHFLELGNNNSGDCILIKVGDMDVLVDAGSKTSSLSTLKSYIDQHVNDGILEYVVVTHAHEDHYANFAGSGKEDTSLFYYYKVENIIQFAKTNQSATSSNGKRTMYGNYLHMRDLEVEAGAKLCNGYEAYNNLNGCKRIMDLGHGVELEILNNEYYQKDSTGENNFSICFLLNQGDNHFLFTGDLEKDGEEKLIELNDLPEVVLFKAGHHGSGTSSSEALLSVIKPKIVVITCVAGSVEYTKNLNNTFPYTTTLENIAKYTDKVYVTSQGAIELKDGKYVDTGYSSLNGNIVVTSSNKGIEVNGSNNNNILKETDWYQNYYKNYRDSKYPW